MDIKEYIDSGILETYVMGSATETEAQELLRYKEQYPEIQNALSELETDMEHIAQYMAIAPPPDMWNRINNNIGELATRPKALRVVPDTEEQDYQYGYSREKRDKYIEVESETTHMRVHKTWKWVLAAVFVLGKIFLIAAIYYYLENRQAQEQIQELKTQLKQYQVK